MSGSRASDHYHAEFDRFAGGDAKGDADGLLALRQEAIARFTDVGFPTRKDEDWRYTNLRALEQADFARAAAHPTSVGAEALGRLLPQDWACDRVVFVDGRVDASLSATAFGEGLTVTLLRDVRGDDQALEAWLAAGDTDEHDDAFACLNAAFVEDGALVTVRRDARPERPLHLVFVSTGHGVAHPRVEIVAEAGSESIVVQDHVSVGDGPTFTNTVGRIAVGAGARLDHVLLQREHGAAFHLSNTRVTQERDSVFHSHVVTLSGALVRNALDVALTEPGATARLDGAFLGGAHQHVENQTLVDHRAPYCESHELYKGVLGGSARGVFRGRVNVRPGAQKTNATQSNPNLLVTNRAEIDSKPQLEIRADDVKCSHGSTIGRLDEDALFFLRARGFTDASARALLTQGFASEVTEHLPGDALAAWADALLRERLHADDGALGGDGEGTR